MSYDQPMDQDRDAYNRNLIDDTVFAARKSGGVAYLLWTFVGGFGMHNFYLGRLKVGALQMAGTLLTYCTYVSPDPWPLAGMAIGAPGDRHQPAGRSVQDAILRRRLQRTPARAAPRRPGGLARRLRLYTSCRKMRISPTTDTAHTPVRTHGMPTR